MKKILMLVVALTAVVPVTVEAQEVFDLPVSEYMRMDNAERNAFLGYVIGSYDLSRAQNSVHQQVKDCIEEWQGKSPGYWLSALGDFMDDHINGYRLRTSPAMEVAVQAILMTCR